MSKLRRRLVVLSLGLVFSRAPFAQAERKLSASIPGFHICGEPTWSPDGNTIAFVAKQGSIPSNNIPTDIWTVARGGGALVNVTNFAPQPQGQEAGGAHRVAWSPAANELAYIFIDSDASGNFRPELTLLTFPSGISTALTTSPFSTFGDSGLDSIGFPPFDNSISWSPDGSTIAFLGHAQDNAAPTVYLIDPGGFELRQLLTATGYAGPVWSPDGSELILSLTTGTNPDGSRKKQLYVVSSTGTNLTAISDPAVDAESPQWAPSSCTPDPDNMFLPCNSGQDPGAVAGAREIAYSCDGQLCISNSVGSHLIQVAPPTGTSVRSIAWSPDGSSIAFESGLHIFVVNAAGTGLKQWTAGVFDDVPVWSPDGGALAYQCQSSNGALDICISTGPVSTLPPPNCGPSTCNGCCLNNQCFLGLTNNACGSPADPQCQVCVSPLTCDASAATCTLATGGGVCGPANCNGCCLNNKCYLGFTNSACGSGGLQCEVCTSPRSCDPSTLTCQLPPGGGVCGPSNCLGCCLNNVCNLGRTNAACGFSGFACAVCTGQQSCDAATLTCQFTTTQNCAANTCNGCCDGNGVCHAGVRNDFCGSGGFACQTCNSFQTCNQDSHTCI